MYIFKFMILLLNLTCIFSFEESSATCVKCNGKDILENKLPPGDRRHSTFLKALELINERKASVLIETGTSRCGLSNCIGDGCSTMIFGEWVKNNGGEFYSVDISLQNLQNAAADLADTRPFVHLVHSDSVEFLVNFNREIDFLYLDSFDYDLQNPIPSQEHHLKEILAAYNLLTEKSVVMIDDCDLPHGGKGKLAIDFLVSQGWRIIAEGYQVILVQ